MEPEAAESQNSVLHRLVKAVVLQDYASITSLASEGLILVIPGPRSLDITIHGSGGAALCSWSKTVHDECGDLTFTIDRYFENGCEMMAAGTMKIQRFPRIFQSDCAIHVRFEQGKIASFKLLFDTHALEKFRGQMD
jgi:hypothetical protein